MYITFVVEKDGSIGTNGEYLSYDSKSNFFEISEFCGSCSPSFIFELVENVANHRLDIVVEDAKKAGFPKIKVGYLKIINENNSRDREKSTIYTHIQSSKR